MGKNHASQYANFGSLQIVRGASNVLSNCCFEIGDFLNLDNALTLYYKSSIFKRLIQM